jgi:hypothetical protein
LTGSGVTVFTSAPTLPFPVAPAPPPPPIASMVTPVTPAGTRTSHDPPE